MIRRQMHPIYGTLCYGKRFISARFPFFYEYGSGTVRCMAVACCSSPVIVGDGVEGLPVICKGANVCLTVYFILNLYCALFVCRCFSLLSVPTERGKRTVRTILIPKDLNIIPIDG